MSLRPLRRPWALGQVHTTRWQTIHRHLRMLLRAPAEPPFGPSMQPAMQPVSSRRCRSFCHRANRSFKYVVMCCSAACFTNPLPFTASSACQSLHDLSAVTAFAQFCRRCSLNDQSPFISAALNWSIDGLLRCSVWPLHAIKSNSKCNKMLQLFDWCCLHDGFCCVFFFPLLFSHARRSHCLPACLPRWWCEHNLL